MEDWVQKLSSGRQDDWNDFITAFHRLIYKVFCTRSFGFSRDEIEELFNDFLVSLMEKKGRKVRLFEGRNQCSFASYIKKIAINMAIDRRKKLNRARVASLNKPLQGWSHDDGSTMQDLVEDETAPPEDHVIDQEEMERFLEAFYRLPLQRMVVVILIIYHRYDREALAALLKTTRQNIDVIYNRTKEQLKTLLEKTGSPAGESTPWKSTITAYQERLLLADRDLLLEACTRSLEPPMDLLVGLVFLNTLVLHPTPERLHPGLEVAGKKLQSYVEKQLEKIAPDADRAASGGA